MSDVKWKYIVLILLLPISISSINNFIGIISLRHEVNHLNSVTFDSSRCPGDETLRYED